QIVQILEVLQKNPSTTGKSTRSPSIRASDRPCSCSAAAPGGPAAAAPPRCLPGICSPPHPRAGTRHGRRPGRGGGGRTKSAAAPPRSLPATELEEGAANAV